MAVDLAGFEAQRRAINDDYSAKQSANTFSRNLGQVNFQNDYDAFNRNFRRSYPSFSAGYGRRGLSNQYGHSGVYQNAMQNYVGDFQRQAAQMQQSQFNNDQQYQNTGAQLEAARQAALQDLQQQQAQAIAEAALQINAVRGTLQ